MRDIDKSAFYKYLQSFFKIRNEITPLIDKMMKDLPSNLIYLKEDDYYKTTKELYRVSDILTSFSLMEGVDRTTNKYLKDIQKNELKAMQYYIKASRLCLKFSRSNTINKKEVAKAINYITEANKLSVLQDIKDRKLVPL